MFSNIYSSDIINKLLSIKKDVGAEINYHKKTFGFIEKPKRYIWFTKELILVLQQLFFLSLLVIQQHEYHKHA